MHPHCPHVDEHHIPLSCPLFLLFGAKQDVPVLVRIAQMLYLMQYCHDSVVWYSNTYNRCILMCWYRFSFTQDTTILTRLLHFSWFWRMFPLLTRRLLQFPTILNTGSKAASASIHPTHTHRSSSGSFTSIHSLKHVTSKSCSRVWCDHGRTWEYLCKDTLLLYTALLQCRMVGICF